MLAESLISPTLPSLSLQHSREQALELMQAHSIDQLVLRGEEHDVAVLDRQTLLDQINEGDHLEKIQPEQLTRQVLYSYQHLLEAIRILNQFNLAVIPVLDAEEHYLGTVAQQTVFRQLSNWAIVGEAGAIIVLKVNWQHYSLNEISAIVESNDFRILGSFITQAPEEDNVLVTLKLNQMSIPSAVRAFERFGYTVAQVFQGENRQQGKEKQHYDALMRYLQI